MLSIKNLSVRVADKPILQDFSLQVPHGQVHAIMGPNGSGKSTLSYFLSGRQGYETDGGEVRMDGEDLLALDVEERAHRGLFLAFQYPTELPGVPMMTFLRASINALREARGEEPLSLPDVMRLVRNACERLAIDLSLLKRFVNVGFSGGEKKRLEILQMTLLQPRLAILDETDSGLDVDALRIVAEGINANRTSERSMVLITHYQRLLNFVKPDRVHIMAGGKIVESGDADLALRLEREGYAAFAA